MSTPPPPPATPMLGRKVQKTFVVPGTKGKRKLYNGEVVAHDAKRRLYQVKYEDDDYEEMNENELKSFMMDEDVVLPRVVTPGGEDNDDDSDFQEEEEDMTKDEDDEEEDYKPARKARPSSKRSRRTETSKPRRRLFVGPSPRSVAVRGLPQGSRAIGRGGFEVRSLDGIPPLLTADSVSKAIKLVASGQHQAAARLLRTEHHSIRAFCKEACRKLGVRIPTTTSLEGGSELSERARERLQEGTVKADADLPGRLLVVRAGTCRTEDTDEPLCPPEVVGCVFESAAELHEQMEERLATYDMDATGDPAFGPWNVVYQRLHTAKLLPTCELNDDKPGMHPKRPFLVHVDWEGGDALPTGSWQMYQSKVVEEYCDSNEEMLWALLEGATREAPPVILGVSSKLIASSVDDHDEQNDEDRHERSEDSSDISLLPTLSREVTQVRLPASLLQKGLRRNFCSPAPVLEACRALLHGDKLGHDSNKKSTPLGGVFQMLSTVWKGMLEDASPFDAPEDGSLLGLEELLLLSLVANADVSWKMPQPLLRKAVATALRTQQQPANLTNIDKTPDSSKRSWRLQEGEGRAIKLQNAQLVMQAALGGKIVHRSTFEKAAPIESVEVGLLKLFERGMPPPTLDKRLQKLDDECRLSAYDTQVSPACLLFMQAILPQPPASWKKHSLPAIARQVRKLVADVNARMPDLHRLTRVAAWGNNKTDAMASMVEKLTETPQKLYLTAREVVTTTGKLSDKEHQIVDCFEMVQRWREQEESRKKSLNPVVASRKTSDQVAPGTFRRAQVGPAPTEYDGRVAFLLAFAKAQEIEVRPEGGDAEVVNVLFCGDPEEPLLVQRIGKARKEAAATMAGPNSGASGAKAVPSLGYVQRSRSKKDRLLVEAAEQAVARSWKGGRAVSLPLPPPGFQWILPQFSPGHEEQEEQSVKLTATLSKKSVWEFTIGGIAVDAFDARKVISSCSLNTQNHKPAPLCPERERLLQIALYNYSDVPPESILESLARLHEIAVETRAMGADEGMVYDWLPLATTGIRAPIWRDAILALKTREKDDVVLGPVRSDGTCKRDMTEGCLLRIFSVLESLYPTALTKIGSLKFRVRPRGAGYNHMLVCLEQLSRGVAQENLADEKLSSIKSPTIEKDEKPQQNSRKRKHRRAAAACKKALASIAASESGKTDSDVDDVACDTTERGKDEDEYEEEKEYLPLPQVTTKLWPHQEASVAKVVAGVKEGRRGHADASAVGAGKTLTALATIVRLAAYMEESREKRNGVLVMLPTKALVKEWLLQLAEHTSGFHVTEQREDGKLFSLTYGKSTPPPPIDGNTIVITTLDRVREHPFVRQAAWDFVVIDECLAVQNAAAKRCPSAWSQIEVSHCGVLMLSATFFRSKYSDLFYMIRMLRTAFPRSMEFLSATIHEHIICQVPETDRSWKMHGEAVALPPDVLAEYRGIVEAYRRNQLNRSSGEAQDFRRLFVDLEAWLRIKYEGRESKTSYSKTSVMAEAFAKACKDLLEQGHRPLVFADTSHEAQHLVGVLCASGLNARTWASVARENVAGNARSQSRQDVIVAVKSVEGQGINMQSHADAIICRPTPGDHLEQMKGRIDRPGQIAKELILVVLMAEHTIEEAKFANIQLAGNFFREYIAPVATRYRERIDLEATLAAGGTTELRPGTVSGTWRRSLEAAGRSGAFARIEDSAGKTAYLNEEPEDGNASKRSRGNDGKASLRTGKNGKAKTTGNVGATERQNENVEPKFAPLNKVLRNKGDLEAVRQAKMMAKRGHASLAVRRWLFPPKRVRSSGLAKESFERFSSATPPLVLDPETIHKAVAHLSKDPRLASLIARVGADALIQDCGDPKPPTQAKLFNYCLRALAFAMVSVDAGNAFLRRLAIKVGVCIESMKPAKRTALLKETLKQMQEGGSEHDHLTSDALLELLLAGESSDLVFTPGLIGALVKTCLVVDGKQTGYPHLCGVTYPCGKNDNHDIFRQKARDHAAGGNVPVSAGFSAPKAGFIISMVNDFESGKITAKKIAEASDRDAAKMLISLKGIGDWSAGGVLVFFLKRANIMLYGDLTVRNFLNDLYDISHNDESETMLESAADFPDTGENRNLIDAVSAANGWEPYRSVVCLLMYHLQEENLVLL